MSIDYKVARNEIGNAIEHVKAGINKGIDYLVGGNHGQQPALAYAGSGSSAEVGQKSEQYRNRAELPSIDTYVNASNTSTKPITNVPRAKFFLEQLYG